MKELNIQVPEGYEVDKEKSTFEKIIFKKIEIKFPKTWEEFCEKNPTKREYFITNCSGIADTGGLNNSSRNYITDKNFLSTFKDAEAHLALIQLHRLRDVYRQGWVPDWRNCSNKWCIYYIENGLTIFPFVSNNRFLSFQSQEVAREFFKNFRDLIEKAKDLI